MFEHTRRSVLKIAGTAIGGIAVGGEVVAAESSDRFLVDLQGQATVRDLENTGLEVVHDLSEIDVAVVRGAEGDVEAVTSEYAPDTAAKFDLPVDGVTAEEGNATDLAADEESATDEPLYPLQWDKQLQDIPAAHEVTRGEGTRVAIIDTGVAADHPDLEHAVNAGLSRNFTDDSYGAPGPWGGYHGTHVAGIAAANDENEEGVVGSAPGTEVVDCRVFSPGALAFFSDILAAIVYSASIGCDAANMSIGAYPIPRQGLGPFYGRLLNRTTTFANSQGTVLVVSAGNAGADLQHDGDVISLPNEAASVLSISATGPIGFLWDADDDGEVTDFAEPPESPAFYTNYGTNAIDLGAPGGDADLDAIGTGVAWYLDLVLSTIAVPNFDGSGDPTASYGYGWAAGTSMSAPQVTGAVALVRSLQPGATADDVKSRLKRAASVPEGYDKTFYGAGLLDPAAAVRGENNDGGN